MNDTFFFIMYIQYQSCWMEGLPQWERSPKSAAKNWNTSPNFDAKNDEALCRMDVYPSKLHYFNNKCSFVPLFRHFRHYIRKK